ncbi:MAG TPA: CopG family ribbon-helix-helix protein [Thermoplasmata archaeon]|jgi:CopG family nickel-responsive transcriptional regulator|nr:CopG family ribbon-helix-helix protein [Thermoplasmata archaeon]
MGIISVSLPDALVDQMDKLAQARGYSGRSDFIRAALREHVYQLGQEQAHRGRRSATITLLYPDELERNVSEINHAFGKLVKSFIHSHVGHGKCVTVFIVEGEGEAIQKLTTQFRKLRNTEIVKAIYTDTAEVPR